MLESSLQSKAVGELCQVETIQVTRGTCNLACVALFEGATLGRWVAIQRSSKKTGKLAAEREEQLLTISFEFEPFKAKWEVSFAKLKRFKLQEGHCNVADGDLFEGANLGTWVKCQRSLKKTRKLTAEREERLLTIGFKFI